MWFSICDRSVGRNGFVRRGEGLLRQHSQTKDENGFVWSDGL